MSSSDLDPVDLSIDFEGTELLSIQYLLSGKNSQYGFKFELMGLNKANFIGSRDEQMLDTQMVQTAEQTGDLRKVTFYISHEDTSNRTRAVQLNFFEDGHVTSSSEVTPDAYNRFVNAIHTTKQSSDYLVSLEELMEDYLYNVELDAEVEWRRDQILTDFETLLSEKLDIAEGDVMESYMYRMLISNIGVDIYERVTDQDVDPEDYTIPSELNGQIQEFFTVYAQHNIPGSGKNEYPVVASEIDKLIKNWSKESDSKFSRGAIGLLEYYTDDYDLDI